MKEREKLGSRLGFILLSAGCAIGLGNVWKFPYMAGQNGGGIFVLMYLLMLALLGIPVLTMEFSIGRAAQKSPVRAYQELEKKGAKWHLHGYVNLVSLVLLMMYYVVVAGWLVMYFVKMIKGDFAGLSSDAVAGEFSSMLSKPGPMIGFMGFVVVVGFFVVGIGLQNGLEKITKYMMIALLLIMVVLAINSFSTEGAREGLSFYLLPKFDSVKEIGFSNIVMGALNQAFFTLSLGTGAMMIFGSYIGRERSLFGEAICVTLLDTFVAVTAGLIIFPACFSHGVTVDAGPSLIFITLPNVFNNMTLGRVWGSLFFLFMCFAALSTVFAVFEAIMACVSDIIGTDRKKTCVLCCVGIFVLALPCVLGYNVWSEFEPLGKGTTVLDLEDFIVSNLLIPIGSIIYVLFCTYEKGWGWKKFLNEVNSGEGLKFPSWLKWYMGIVVPLVIGIILVAGLI